MTTSDSLLRLTKRFRHFLPIVIDLETSGLNPLTAAILEIAAVTLTVDPNGKLQPNQTYAYQVEPFIGAHLDPESLELTKIDPTYPLRYAIPERQALHRLFRRTKALLAQTEYPRAILVGHNAWFDLSFLQAATKRCHLVAENPFHSFTSFDTATLSGIFLGETVLAKAARCAKIAFDVNQAHSAIYDAERTAELFCFLVNKVNK